MTFQRWIASFTVIGLSAGVYAAGIAELAPARPAVTAADTVRIAHADVRPVSKDLPAPPAVTAGAHPDIDMYLSFHEEAVAIAPRALNTPWSGAHRLTN